MLNNGIPFSAISASHDDGSRQAGFGGALPVFTMVIAAMLMMGCASQPHLSDVYDAYDARVDRELVAGHDDVRGNYVEVRISPRRMNTADGKAVVE